MNTKIYVGNLPYTVYDQELAEIFLPFGEVVSSRVITDRETGRSKGFGFVEMATEQSARDAIAALNTKPINGRPLTVNEARPQEPRARGGYNGGNGGGGGYGGGGSRGGDGNGY